MRVITDKLKKHLNSEVTTFATCWKLILKDDTVFGFTDCDKDLLIDDLFYLANTGFNTSSIESSSDLAVDNLEIQGIVDNEMITEKDLLSGRYDHAEVFIFKVNYEDLSIGKINLRKGWLGEIRVDRNKFIVEIRGLMQALSNGIGKLYSPKCRANFGDKECKLCLKSFTKKGRIELITGDSSFYDATLKEDNGYYDYGVITFSSGKNKGLEMEVKSHHESNIDLMLPMQYDITVNDEYFIIPGCNKDFFTCCNKFKNALNFRGEPHILRV